MTAMWMRRRWAAKRGVPGWGLGSPARMVMP
jgi:hypothetical protein